MRIGVLTSRIRVEEKLLLAELTRRDVPHEIIDDRSVIFDLGLLYAPALLVLWGASIAFIAAYRISRATHEANLQKLSGTS